jgi:hypothetical protein
MATTATTSQPQSPLELQKAALGTSWNNLGSALYNMYDAGLSDREKLDRNLTIWNNLYEMRRAPRNWPWPNASNVVPMVIPTQLDTMLANIVLAVYAVQRFYVVNGNTDIAAQHQHDVEFFLNAELTRQRPGLTWLMQHVESLFAALRDGNGITAITYRKEFATHRAAIVERLKDPESGIDILDPMTGKPIIHTHTEEMTMPVYDDVELQTIELRDFGVIPAWQTNIDKAATVWRRAYLDSNQLYAMCRSEKNPKGPLRREAVEYAMSYLAPGETELKYSRQGYSTYTIAGQIEIGDEEGAMSVPELKQHKGPYEIIIMNSNAYFDGKEHVLWLHPYSQTCLGFDRYQCWHGERPYSVKTPLARVNRFYGLSLVERMAPSAEEMASNRNRRNDFLDQRTLPPMYEVEGAKLVTKKNAWGPDARWKVPNKDAIGFIPLPDVSAIMAGVEEENIMKADIEAFTGNTAPLLGEASSGRPTAKGIQAAIARAGVRHNFVAMNVRDADLRTLRQIVALKLQYGPDILETDTSIGGQPKKLSIPKDVLAQDYTWSITGSGGPLDKATRTQEMQSLYAILMQNPIIAQDPVKIWAVTRMLLEEYNRADVLALIGTRDEAEQQKKLMEMMRAKGMDPSQMGAPGGQHGKPQQHHPAQQGFPA